MRGSRTTIRHFFQKAALYATRILAFPFRGKCLRKQTIEVDSNFFLFPSLPLGGKVDKAKLWTNEGQPNNNQAFSRQKAALYSTRVPGFPVGEAVGFCRLKRSFFPLQALPLPEKNSANFISSAKIVNRFVLSPSSTPSPSKAFPPLLFLRCYIPAFVAPALPVHFNPRFSSYPLFSKTISRRNPFAPDRCFRRKHNYYLITFPKTPFIVPRFFILNANICSFFYSITYKTCQHIAIFRKFFHFFYRLF